MLPSSIFNAIGHLTKRDFIQALHNIHTNLKQGGLYVFDIFNLIYLLHENNITRLTIDWQTKLEKSTVREIQYSTISKDGILASYDIYHEQKQDGEPFVTNAFQTLQVYSSDQLQELLMQAGFKVITQCTMDGSPFHQIESERIVTIAQKI